MKRRKMRARPRVQPPVGSRRLLLPALTALTGIAILLGLGFWQVERKQWKEALIATLTERSRAAPVSLPAPESWSGLPAADWEYRRVLLRARFLRDARPVWLFVSSSALRSDIKAPGYYVFSPARLPDGRIVVVNRGYVAETNVTLQPADDEIEIVGYLRWPQSPSWFVADRDSKGDVWFAFDQRTMATARGWGEVAPFYLDQESPLPPGGIPRTGPLTVSLRNNHLGYALTWFGLAAGLAVVFALWLHKQTVTRKKTDSL